jgi:hypothetical protein
MSQPIGSACCKNTVSGPVDGTYDVFICDDCEQICEVIE